MDRESILPLSLSALLAVSLHVSLFVWPGLPAVHANETSPKPLPNKPLLPDPKPLPAPKPPEPPLPEKPLPKPPEPKPPEPTPPTPKPPEPAPPVPVPPKPKPPEPLPPKPKPPEPTPPEPVPSEPRPPAPAAKPLEVGRAGEPVRSTIAWIPYDDFKELMAPQSLTIQPALQMDADPVKDAPIEMNPTSASPTPATVLVPTRTRQQEQTPDPQTASVAPSKPTPTQAAESTAQDSLQPAGGPAESSAALTPSPNAMPDGIQADVKPTDPTTDVPAASAQKSPADALANRDATPPSASTSTNTTKAAQNASASSKAATASASIDLPQGNGAPSLPIPQTGESSSAASGEIENDATPDKSTPDKSAPDKSTVASASSSDSTLPTKNPTDPSPESSPKPSAADDTNRLALAPSRLPRQPSLTDESDNAPTGKPKNSTPTGSAEKPDASSASTASKSPASAIASESNEDRPTSVPRSDRESVATQTTPMPDQIVLGKVLVSDGIEIKTVRPRFHISTLFTASPRNPVATIVFDKSGQVIRAELLISSGFADIDSPILNSLYRWRASGKKLEDHKSDTFTIYHMKLLLVDEREKDKSATEDATSQNTDDSQPDAQSDNQPPASPANE